MSTGSFMRFGGAAGRWRRKVICGGVVALAALAVVPAAYASTWSVQPLQTQSTWVRADLSGVSCNATNDCYAVGFEEQSNGINTALIEKWNGSSWFIWYNAVPARATDSSLSGISCPFGGTFCMAVGEYDNGSAPTPLVYTWSTTTGGFAQQTAPSAPGEPGDSLNSVSCQSASFCVAVGGYVGYPPLADVWNGSSFSQPPQGANSANAALFSVSCAAAQSGLCVAVGGVDLGQVPGAPPGIRLIRPYAETYNNGKWVADSASSNGQFVLQPANTVDAVLTSVYCLTAQNCAAVGNWYGPILTKVNPWAAELSSGGWALQSPPPSNADAGFSVGEALTCPSECWALGNYLGNTGLQGFADDLNGLADEVAAPQWGFTSLPSPGGTQPSPQAISCGAINDCESVGSYVNSAGHEQPFAEQYYYALPSTGCTHAPCRPPKPGTPHRYSLSVRGTEAQGATVSVELHKPRSLVLLMRGVLHKRPAIIGQVALGSHPAGMSRIHWNLHVNGAPLRPGTYEVSVHSVAAGILGPSTPPGDVTLTVPRDRHVKVG